MITLIRGDALSANGLPHAGGRSIFLTFEQFPKTCWFEISFASALLLPPAMIEIL
jgi:hypothetical protein